MTMLLLCVTVMDAMCLCEVWRLVWPCCCCVTVVDAVCVCVRSGGWCDHAVVVCDCD